MTMTAGRRFASCGSLRTTAHERTAACPPPRLAESRAQGTVEYALTVVAFLAMAAAFGLLWRAGERGAFTDLANAAASHGLDALGALDIALF